MSLYQKCIPDYYFESIFEIPYQTLKEQGINTLFFDLDNTIISYDEDVLSEEQVNFLLELSKNFQIAILSNSGYKRVSKAVGHTSFPYIYHSKKPTKLGFKQALKKVHAKKEEILVIGDQLMTDVLGANRMGFSSCLIKSVKRKSDRKITQFNRKLEKFILKKIEKKYPDLYIERLEKYVNDHQM